MDLESVYLLAGPETGKKNDFIRKIRENLSSSGEAPEEHRFYAYDTSPDSLVEILRNGSLFSSRKLVLYFGADAVKSKENAKPLAEYIASPSRDSTLVLITDEYGVEKSIEDAVGKQRKQMFFELFENEKKRWIEDYFRNAGLSVDDSAIETILDLVQNDTESLKTECGRLLLFFPKGASLGSDDVEKYLMHGRPEDAFSLFRRIAEGDQAKALDTLGAIMRAREGNSIQLMAGLGWAFRTLSKIAAALESGENADSVFLSCGVRSKLKQKPYVDAIRRYGRKGAERILSLVSETDFRLRQTGTQLERCTLELFVSGAMNGSSSLPFTEPPDRSLT